MPGKWYIIGSTFKMWTSGKKTNPSITYSILNSDPLKILDKVQYQSKGKTKSIVGYDTLKKGLFIWRGKGMLKPFTSEWETLYIDSDILIIKFSSTLVTPSGLDVLLRDRQNAATYKKQLHAHPTSFNLKSETVQELKWLY
ncbi:hypothetical protein BTJ66_10475 [Staphylococcus edaphicus]|uniref:Lipocalin-like domain-containing protein n=1 Tax=Staphylococcus edaphicus TaxID=1955013 RepID=A0A2C6WIW5_9STAP|nr:hypothetical protein BTJ66_10475 [Staphylococcus edaphicus]